MTPSEKREKNIFFILLVAYFAVGYLTTNWIASHNTSFFNVSFVFEKRIPFLPIFSLGYAGVYVGIFLAYCIIDDIREWRRAVVGVLVLSTICYSFFIFLPVQMTMRPEITPSNNIFLAITKFFYSIDLPQNCFPSLHVAYPTIATIAVWKRHTRIRWAMAAMALVVAVSVVFVKQHYIADVLAGFAAAAVSYFIALKTEKVWTGFFLRLSSVLLQLPQRRFVV